MYCVLKRQFFFEAPVIPCQFLGGIDLFNY